MKTVAFIGSPNAGKSSIFNAIGKSKLSVTYDSPFVTRDRVETVVSHYYSDFKMIDTAGVHFDKNIPFMKDCNDQSIAAIDEADIIIFVVDYKSGCTNEQKQIAKWIRKYANNKPTLLVVNKCDKANVSIEEFCSLGFAEIRISSTTTGIGVSQIIDYILSKINNEGVVEENKEDCIQNNLSEDIINVVIYGSQNSGKSTLMNALLGKNRCIISDMPGTTRDAVTVSFKYYNYKINLTDTAGKRMKIRDEIDKLSMNQSDMSIRKADIAILMIDCSTELDRLDLKLSAFVEDNGVTPIICFNKVDLIDEYKQKDIIKLFHNRWGQIKNVSILFISALKKSGLDKLSKAIVSEYSKYNKHISTGILNRFIKYLTNKTPPTMHNNSVVNIKFVKQVSTKPPTFIFFINKKDAFSDAYKKFIINKMREHFNFGNSPIRIKMQVSDNPYV